MGRGGRLRVTIENGDSGSSHGVNVAGGLTRVGAARSPRAGYGGAGHHSNALVIIVGDVEVSILVNRHAGWLIQISAGRRHAVSDIAAAYSGLPRDRCDDSRPRIDFADCAIAF